jgi:hypothetical protein
MKWKLSILNERLEFEVAVSNNIYKVNIITFKKKKKLNNIKLCSLLNILTLNFDHKIDRNNCTTRPWS